MPPAQSGLPQVHFLGSTPDDSEGARSTGEGVVLIFPRLLLIPRAAPTKALVVDARARALRASRPSVPRAIGDYH